MPAAPKHYQIFESYFQTTSVPSLKDFVVKQTRAIATLHNNDEDLKIAWTERYKKVHKLFYGQKGKTEKRRLNTRKANWDSVALSILKVVKNTLYNFGLEEAYEHSCHSFILDLGDEKIKEEFTQEELDEIYGENPHPLLPAVPQLLDYVNGYINLSFIDDAFDNMKMDVRRLINRFITFSIKLPRQNQRFLWSSILVNFSKRKHKTDLLLKVVRGEVLNMLKNQLYNLSKVCPEEVEELVVVGFVIIGLKLRIIVMDNLGD
ncbi:hypothetical protein BDC45DRAFT_538520 [Circinella umbellata]|nr:hypothetical protein BDC45DRAFT_538520 [Circinella umbellata]